MLWGTDVIGPFAMKCFDWSNSDRAFKTIIGVQNEKEWAEKWVIIPCSTYANIGQTRCIITRTPLSPVIYSYLALPTAIVQLSKSKLLQCITDPQLTYRYLLLSPAIYCHSL